MSTFLLCSGGLDSSGSESLLLSIRIFVSCWTTRGGSGTSDVQFQTEFGNRVTATATLISSDSSPLRS